MANLEDVKNSAQGVKIKLGDEEYRLLYDLNSFAMIEEEYGDIQKAFEEISKGKSYKHIKRLLYLGLIHDKATEFDESGEPTAWSIKPYDVARYVTLDNMEDIFSKIMQASMNCSPRDLEAISKVVKEEIEKDPTLANITEEEMAMKAKMELERKND